MTHVKLMGELGEKFGTDWHMATSSFRDIFKLIDCQTEGFKNYIQQKAEEGVDFDILNGEDLLEDGYSVLLEKPKDIVVITPKAAGAKLSDALKIIVGALLIWYGPSWIEGLTREAASAAAGVGEFETAAAIVKYGEIASWGVTTLGVGLAMSGVVGYMTPESPSEAGDSYLFDGPQNNTKQGIPVPLLYGELIVGGALTNIGFIDTKINYQQTGYTIISPDTSSPNGSYGDQGQDENGHNKAGGGGNGASGQFK
jgi:predicted phage tail protein|tara:strand:+ start:4045 stop:4809 length:765 start_codon:yes stop_codon:yes gene_type:complete